VIGFYVRIGKTRMEMSSTGCEIMKKRKNAFQRQFQKESVQKGAGMG
jgi:hypothetical protein